MPTSQYIVHLDRKIEFMAGTGVFGGVNTVWTLPFTDNTLNCVVPASGANDGVALTPISNVAGVVTVAGNYSAIAVTIGRKYTSRIGLSRPYMRDQNGRPVLRATYLIRGLALHHRRTGTYTVRMTRPPASDVSETFTPPTGLIHNLGVFQCFLAGNPEYSDWFIEDNSPRPFMLPSIEWLGDYGESCR